MAGLEGRFHGTCALVRVQLMRAAASNDVEAALRDVRGRGLVSAEDEALVRACFALDERLGVGARGGMRGAGAQGEPTCAADPDGLLTLETIARLHNIVSMRLNVADSA